MGNQFAKWWAESAPSSESQGEGMARSAWDAALLAADEVMPFIHCERYEVATVLRNQFSKWWAACVGSRGGESEGLARSAWDAAVRAAVVLLDDEVRRAVRSHQLELAAAFRDRQELTEALFTSPGQWSWKQRLQEEEVEKWKGILRRFNEKQLEEVRRVSRPGSPQATALASILQERGGAEP